MTALFDGVGDAIESLRSLPDDDNTSYLVLVITDGKENQSQRFSELDIVRLLKETQATDRWSFAFQLPSGLGDYFAREFGIPSDNIREWEATERGMVETQVCTQSALGAYFGARSKGQKKVTKLFTTDLSKLDTKTVRGNLDDISDRFRIYEVAKEIAIKTFVEAKTGKPYVLGSAYYQLMKTEKIQPQKEVLLIEKGKKSVWGGQQARDLIGLPSNEIVKCVPGNHSGYDVFVASTSTNRILVRGTRLLVDTKKKSHSKPTWETQPTVN